MCTYINPQVDMSALFKNTSAIHLTQLQDTEASGTVQLRGQQYWEMCPISEPRKKHTFNVAHSSSTTADEQQMSLYDHTVVPHWSNPTQRQD